MTGVYFVSTNNQKVGRVIVENPHVTFWYVEDAWENMSYLPGLLEFTRLWLWCIYYHFSVLWYSGNHLVKGLLENTSVLILTTNGISGNCVEFRL